MDQSVSALSATVNSLTLQASASVPNVTSLDSRWASLQVEANSLQSALAANTSVAINSAVSTLSQLLSYYNQSYASVVAISTNVVASYNQLTTSVANIVSQQGAALKQLGVLRNNTMDYLATAQSLLTQANNVKAMAILQVSQSIQAASLAANNSQTYQKMISSLNASIASLRNSASEVQRRGNEVNALAAEMRTNASAVSIYATQLQNDITATVPDHSQVFSRLTKSAFALQLPSI